MAAADDPEHRNGTVVPTVPARPCLLAGTIVPSDGVPTAPNVGAARKGPLPAGQPTPFLVPNDRGHASFLGPRRTATAARLTPSGRRGPGGPSARRCAPTGGAKHRCGPPGSGREGAGTRDRRTDPAPRTGCCWASEAPGRGAAEWASALLMTTLRDCALIAILARGGARAPAVGAVLGDAAGSAVWYAVSPSVATGRGCQVLGVDPGRCPVLHSDRHLAPVSPRGRRPRRSPRPRCPPGRIALDRHHKISCLARRSSLRRLSNKITSCRQRSARCHDHARRGSGTRNGRSKNGRRFRNGRRGTVLRHGRNGHAERPRGTVGTVARKGDFWIMERPWNGAMGTGRNGRPERPWHDGAATHGTATRSDTHRVDGAWRVSHRPWR